jgi:hypothetical protein
LCRSSKHSRPEIIETSVAEPEPHHFGIEPESEAKRQEALAFNLMFNMRRFLKMTQAVTIYCFSQSHLQQFQSYILGKFALILLLFFPGS